MAEGRRQRWRVWHWRMPFSGRCSQLCCFRWSVEPFDLAAPRQFCGRGASFPPKLVWSTGSLALGIATPALMASWFNRPFRVALAVEFGEGRHHIGGPDRGVSTTAAYAFARLKFGTRRHG